jgi:hypothetical protein
MLFANTGEVLFCLSIKVKVYERKVPGCGAYTTTQTFFERREL